MDAALSFGFSLLGSIFAIEETGSLLQTIVAFSLALVLTLLLGRLSIRWLRKFCPEPLASPSAQINELHKSKRRTPTMGGAFLLSGLVVALLICGNWDSNWLWIAILLTVLFAALGAIDDLRKLRTGKRGLTAQQKLFGQIITASVVALLLYREFDSRNVALCVYLPPTDIIVPIDWLFVPLAIVVLVGSSNAVNLADGLDGLASGCLLTAVSALGGIAYVSGDPHLAAVWGLPFISAARDFCVLATALSGALLGFLAFNRHPAKVFMGDTGSLPLGGLLGLMAIVLRQELLLLVIGGVFVVETLSVMLQVTYFRSFGRRFFRCAPLHHHFQFLGWSEWRIVCSFWLAGALCALSGVGLIALGK